jgi:DNA-binding transcriptional regulator YiaG
MDSTELVALSFARRLAASGEAKAIRLRAALSLRDIGDAAGTTPSAVWRWERGERRPQGPAGVAYGRLLRDLLAARPRRKTASF